MSKENSLDTRQKLLLRDRIGQLIACAEAIILVVLRVALLEVVGDLLDVVLLLHAVVERAMPMQVVRRVAVHLFLLLQHLVVAVFGTFLFFFFLLVVILCNNPIIEKLIKVF